MKNAKSPGGSDEKTNAAPTVKPTKTGAADSRRARRARPVPRWLKQSAELEDVAKRRCLLVLSVLSGERPVTDVIEEAQISRGTYYQLEERALAAMLRALSPTTAPDGSEVASLSAALAKVAELEAKLARMEKEKRRADRLLFLTRKLMKPGPVTMGTGWPAGRPRGPRMPSGTSSTPSSPSVSPSLTATSPPSPSVAPSIPTKAGATAR